MIARRSVLAASAALFSAPASEGVAAAQAPLRFGIVADPQYAEIPPHLGMNRYYANSPDKLRAAIATFNTTHLDFVATLGDLIDRDWASFDRIMPIYDDLRTGTRFVLGNHDFDVEAVRLASVAGRLGLERSHYDFAVKGVRFIVLDGNDVSLFAPPPGDLRRDLAAERLARLKESGAIQANPWNGSLSDAQFRWLEQMLAKARSDGERVIVLSHYPVFPTNQHNMWDSQRIVDLLTSQDHVIAYFCGHNHDGNYGEVAGLHFVNFAGMVDTPTENAYAIVELLGDKLEIRGFGREPSRTLRLRSA